MTTYTVAVTFESLDGTREPRTVSHTVTAGRPGTAAKRALDLTPAMLAWGSVVLVIERLPAERPEPVPQELTQDAPSLPQTGQSGSPLPDRAS